MVIKSKSKSKKWSLKYKRSINCNKPKGFSQKQYCKSRSKKPTLKSRSKKPILKSRSKKPTLKSRSKKPTLKSRSKKPTLKSRVNSKRVYKLGNEIDRIKYFYDNIYKDLNKDSYYLGISYYITMNKLKNKELAKEFKFETFIEKYFNKLNKIINDENQLNKIIMDLNNSFEKGYEYEKNN